MEFVTFDIMTDVEEEGPEAFTLTLSKLSGSGTIDNIGHTAIVTIQDQTGTTEILNSNIVILISFISCYTCTLSQI